jgi:hypothetical protein
LSLFVLLCFSFSYYSYPPSFPSLP